MSVHPIDARASAVQLAATWLREQNPRPSPVVPALRERFGLSALEAVQAIQMHLSTGRPS